MSDASDSQNPNSSDILGYKEAPDENESLPASTSRTESDPPPSPPPKPLKKDKGKDYSQVSPSSKGSMPSTSLVGHTREDKKRFSKSKKKKIKRELVDATEPYYYAGLDKDMLREKFKNTEKMWGSHPVSNFI